MCDPIYCVFVLHWTCRSIISLIVMSTKLPATASKLYILAYYWHTLNANIRAIREDKIVWILFFSQMCKVYRGSHGLFHPEQVSTPMSSSLEAATKLSCFFLWYFHHLFCCKNHMVRCRGNLSVSAAIIFRNCSFQLSKLQKKCNQ